MRALALQSARMTETSRQGYQAKAILINAKANREVMREVPIVVVELNQKMQCQPYVGLKN